MSWHPSNHPLQDALREGSLTRWDFPKFGLQCRKAAPTDRLNVRGRHVAEALEKVYKVSLLTRMRYAFTLYTQVTESVRV